MQRVATLLFTPLRPSPSTPTPPPPLADADARHLAEARDHADLERRLRRLERGRDERFASLQEWAP